MWLIPIVVCFIAFVIFCYGMYKLETRIYDIEKSLDDINIRLKKVEDNVSN